MARGTPGGMKRELFAELTEGFDALKAEREGKRALRKQERDLFHALTLAFQGQAPVPLPSG